MNYCDRCNCILKRYYLEAKEINSDEIYVFCSHECYKQFSELCDLDSCDVSLIDTMMLEEEE